MTALLSNNGQIDAHKCVNLRLLLAMIAKNETIGTCGDRTETHYFYNCALQSNSQPLILAQATVLILVGRAHPTLAMYICAKCRYIWVFTCNWHILLNSPYFRSAIISRATCAAEGKNIVVTMR